jgi:adenylate kinase family enzyme
MIILITGASHTGKTLLAQKLLENYNWPYISMDHIKMGLIRSGYTSLTPYDDEEMTGYLWPVIREIIKTATENKQNLIIEGGYVPQDWEKDFSDDYLDNIRFYCIVMTEEYIRTHFDDIKKYASVIENRGDDSDFDMETAIKENKEYNERFRECKSGLILIEKEFKKTEEMI